METITRQEAIKKGLKRYFTGIPCKHGHVSERNVGSCNCVICYIDSNKRTSKIRYKKNRESLLSDNKNYTKKCKRCHRLIPDNSVYCSSGCFWPNKNNHNYVEKKCDYCGEKFRVKDFHNVNKYCSRACSDSGKFIKDSNRFPCGQISRKSQVTFRECRICNEWFLKKISNKLYMF